MDVFLVTCEHGGNRIPAAYRSLFRGQKPLLDSHRGYDPGALTMARALAAELKAPLVESTVSRLLIDLNRPVGHPQLFSAITRKAPAGMRAEIACRHHKPYQTKVEHLVRQSVDGGRRMIHISSHSFVGELEGEVRRADVGLLYHPGRCGESALCARWKDQLAVHAPELLVRRNYPYEGKAAGLTALLRRRFSAEAYIGIELEVNQDLVAGAGQPWKRLCRVLPESLLAACPGRPGSSISGDL